MPPRNAAVFFYFAAINFVEISGYRNFDISKAANRYSVTLRARVKFYKITAEQPDEDDFF